MKNKNLLLLALILLFQPAWSAETKYSPNEVQNRMNQIYYWHLAQELNISAEQEKEMVRILEQSQKKRGELMGAREEALKVFKSVSSSHQPKVNANDLAAALKSYDTINHDLTHVDRDEFAALRKVFGDQALAQFLIVRDSITERLRNSIRNTPTSSR
jgi:hypothetical protein